MIPFWFDNSFTSLVQWLPVLMSSLALLASQFIGRSA